MIDRPALSNRMSIWLASYHPNRPVPLPGRHTTGSPAGVVQHTSGWEDPATSLENAMRVPSGLQRALVSVPGSLVTRRTRLVARSTVARSAHRFAFHRSVENTRLRPSGDHDGPWSSRTESVTWRGFPSGPTTNNFAAADSGTSRPNAQCIPSGLGARSPRFPALVSVGYDE